MSDTRELVDIAAEKIVLGSVMQAPTVADLVLDVIRSPEDFGHPAHQLLYRQMVANLAAGEPVDAVALAHTLDSTDPQGFARVGGRAYLYELIESVPTAANATWYAHVVAGFATRRRLLAAAVQVRDLAYSLDLDVAEAVNRAQQAVQDATLARPAAHLRRIGQVVDEHLPAMLSEERPRRGLSTGLGELDGVIGGLKPGQLVLVAGRPGTGKSILCANVARAAVRRDVPVLFVSLEMQESEVLARLLAAEATVNLYSIENSRLTADERARIAAVAPRFHPWPMHIDTPAAADLGSVRSAARRLKARHGLGLVVVDYLQLMSSTAKRDSRVQELAEISRGLKLLAMDLELPILAAAQLNRQSEARADKRPQLSDLRESGSLEQDSDVVILIHRPDLHDPDDPRAGEVDLIVAKNRNGPVLTVTAMAQLPYARFVDMAVT